ncbi:TolB family protein [Clostridium peptidivorans]|uniref:TolB family protein n=1 Tax=Clostridium peptidivorans TaxID=100174 RepID=UPI000BE2DED1|nr:hypothetical protein [Clostridium peptidivorans]
MNHENKNWKAKALVGGLLVLGAVSIAYSYSKPLMTSNKSVVVSDNKSKAVNLDEDKPLQVVKSEKTDGIEGFNAMMGLLTENEAVIRVGMNRKDIEERLKKLPKNNQAEEVRFINDVRGETYKLNLSTLEKSPINFEDWSIISPDKTKYAYVTNENGKQAFYIVDIKSNSKKRINMNGTISRPEWDKNSKYIVGLGLSDLLSIVVYDVENDKIKEFKDDSININPLSGVYSSNGKDIYFVGTNFVKTNNENNNKKTIVTEGVYKLNTADGKMEPIMLLPAAEASSLKNRISNQGFAVIDEGQKVVFDGDLNGDNGLFIYDVKSKKTNKVTESPGTHFVPFWLSPDENKIIYATYSGKDNTGVWSIYAAKIKGNELVNKILLIEDVNYYNMISQKPVWWNNDSNKVTIFESKNFTLDTRVFAEKGIVHSIYFK